MMNTRQGSDTTVTRTCASLLSQRLPSSSPRATLHASLLSLAICDALGGPAEFHKRGSFALISTFLPNRNFSLPPGTWTDDTSMTLCLAQSLSKSQTFDGEDHVRNYTKWWQHGYLSATGYCFDIGNTCKSALEIHSKHKHHDEAIVEVQNKLDVDRSCGNGSLMRVSPIGLVYWRTPDKAVQYAMLESRLTHPAMRCQEACAVYTRLLCTIIQQSTIADNRFTKLDLLRQLATYPFTDSALHDEFSCPLEKIESHPLLRKSVADISSSGYVLHTLAAVLWVFFTTDSFEEGAIRCVNLGDDADTVAAIYGGLAGCWYIDRQDIPSEETKLGGFWGSQLSAWYDGLRDRRTVEKCASELYDFMATLD